MIEELWSGLINLSATFVTPDWGALVLLIPFGLAALVFLYLTWTIYRFATAGPTRRGKRRLAPVTPAGIHMPGPSFAPLLAAVGAFFLVFGMVAGGIWLGVGGLILVVTLLYWGREEMRSFDRVPSGSTAGASGAAIGALPPPRGTPPAGVHIPPPSFRPLLVAIGFTALVTGMIIGGWGLVLGLGALVLTLLGWLWDARKEYVAVEDADRSGHLDLGGAPAWPKAIFAVLAIIVLAALVLTTQVVPDTGTGSGTPAASGAPGASGAPAGGGTTASAAPSLPAADVTVTAEGIKFTEAAITIPAGKPFTLAFDNRDPATAHNVAIHGAGAAEIYTGAIITGPAVVVYDVPAIPPGQYTFVCTVHPNMTGTVTAQ